MSAGDIGVATTAAQVQAFQQADLLLALGTRLTEWDTLDYAFPTATWPRQPLVHVCADAQAIGKNFQVTVGSVCRGPEFARALLDVESAPKPPRDSAWVRQLHDGAQALSVWKTATATDGVVFGNVVNALASLLPEAVSIVPDAGVSAALVYRYFPFARQRKLYSTMSGVMGFGVPGAVAVALREPRRPVVCLVGDGGFMMTGNELAIAVERKLPLRIFLSNNRSLGTIRFHQERLYPGRGHATDLSGPGFASLAQAFGCTAMVLDREEDIATTINAALAVAGPVLVEVKSSLSAILPKNGAAARAMEHES